MTPTDLALPQPHALHLQNERMHRRTLLAGMIAALPLFAPAPALAAASSTFSSRRIVIDNIGSGRDAILIPGLGAGPAVWNRLVSDLPGYRWHRVHVRGFAGLAAGANATGPLIAPVADEIARYISDRKLATPPLIGHSMGGMLAMLTALRHPGRAGPVMVIDMMPAGAAMVGGTSAGVGFLSRQLKNYFTGTTAGRRAFAALVQDAGPGTAANDPDVIATALDELANMDLGPRLASFRSPLTVVPGLPARQEERTALLRRVRSAYAAARQVRIMPVERSGHMVMADQPAAFAAVVRSFLRRP